MIHFWLMTLSGPRTSPLMVSTQPSKSPQRRLQGLPGTLLQLGDTITRKRYAEYVNPSLEATVR